jgi:ankyrin repeat protein
MASVAPSSPIRIAELREHVEQGRVAELKMLLAELADEKCLYEHVGARDAVGNTAFHLACHHGHIECVRLLEESSSNTFAQTSAGMSGLMIAVERGHNKLCQHLLPMADLEATCNKGWTAFIHACAAGQADCVEILVRADCDTKVCTQHCSS